LPQIQNNLMSQFSNISEEEYKKLKESYAVIAALVGGADGTVDEDEQEWAKKIVSIRSFSGNENLFPFYNEVKTEIEDDLNTLILALSGPFETIQSALAERLSGINPILAKLPPKTAYHIYKGYLSFAEHIAKASGGIFRFFAVSKEEKKWLNLTMLNPIEEPAEEEE